MGILEGDEVIWRGRARLVWVLLVLAGVGWFLLEGGHEHRLEINRAAGSVCILSRHSPFRVSPSGVPDWKLPAQTFYFGYCAVRCLGSGNILPCNIAGVGFIHSRWVVNLPDDLTTVAFLVNGVEFTLEGDELRAAGRHWKLQPAQVVEVNVDELR